MVFSRPPRTVHVVAERLPSVEAPSGQRIPFAWSAAPIERELKLSFPASGTHLRIVNALDSREPRSLEAFTTQTRIPLGVFDLRYSYALQPFELPVPPTAARLVAAEGITLRRLSGATPVWILTAQAPPALLPHLLVRPPDTPKREFHHRLTGLESAQPFGWMEGCVLDALSDLRETAALNAHLRLFLPSGGKLLYEDPRSRPSDDRIDNIEETLPFAAIAGHLGDHPTLQLALAYWRDHHDAEGCVVSGGLTSAEGSYTVAWPMAALARRLANRALEDDALHQLRLRQKRLVNPAGLWLRHTSQGALSFRNWGRGVAWYSLGLARTLSVLRDRPDLDDLKQELTRWVSWVLAFQRPDGLWHCFLDEPASGPETSGSAGIAAAIALAARLGLANSSAKKAAERTARALEGWLTPDGFLHGVAQSNRGGEALQRSGYRVISQMAMGLYGQLLAALERRP